MLIQPNTQIRLIRNCPLDNRYEHTILFSSPQEQENYFKGLEGVPFSKQSYQRYALGVLHVQAPMESLYNCNYLMFKNDSFENKWFYAFITKVEYVNNVSCKVYYEIDIMQTWRFNYELGECFVEREHSLTDVIGENLVHEDIYFGPYIYGQQVTPQTGSGLSMQDLSIVIMYNPDLFNLTEWAVESNFSYTRNFYGGVYQGVNFLAVPALEENMDNLEMLIKSIDFTTFGGFLAAFIMPTMFLPIERSSYNEYNNHVSFNLDRNTDFDGYTPKNKKLFTYPYTCANLTSNRNEGNDFAFEYFVADETKEELVGSVATFMATGNLSANPSAMAYPLYYKRIMYYTEGAVNIPSYPICTWGADGVTEWINNNMFKSLATIGVMGAMGAVSPASSLGAGIAGQKMLTGETSIAGHLYNAYNDLSNGIGSFSGTSMGILTAIGMARSEFDPGNVHGSVDGDVLIGTIGGRNITARVKHITAQYAKIVDDYFTKFGYATMRIKVPNRDSRPFWNYVKTQGCVITGSIPADDMNRICAIYDHGITFWKNGATIGDYFNQDNSV